MTKIISKFLAIIMIINIMSINNPMLTFANDLDEVNTPLVKLSTYKDGNIKESIYEGQKGIEYNIDSLHIKHDEEFKIDNSNFNTSNLEKHIKVIVNGKTEDYINTENDKLKFNFKYDELNKTIKVEIKEGQSNNTHMKPFILRKHSLYDIKIPEGLFIDDNGTKSEEINYTFTTKGDGLYGKDIIRNTSPSDKSTIIDYKKGEIIVNFIDDIDLNEDVVKNKQRYFELRSSSVTSPNVDEFDNTKLEDINNYTISYSGNKLKLVSKTGRLNDFATYNLTLKNGAVELKNSKNLINGTIISNSPQNIVFSTDNWIERVNLSTGWLDYKLPLGNIEDVPVNPLIQLEFKYRVDLKDKSKIKFSSDAHDFSIDVNEDSWINYDGNTLKLDINSLHRNGENPLRKNTAYKITIEKGALRLRDYNSSKTNGQIENEEMKIYFITGDWTTNADSGLYITGYSSDHAKTDDLTKIDGTSIGSTKLDRNGEIYIHFNRDIQWNKWRTGVSNDSQALPHFKLYKTPSAYERDYSEKGVTFDKQFRFDHKLDIYTKNGVTRDEIPLESVTLYGNKIKIKPKYELTNFNEYRIELYNKDIITDFHEKKLMNIIDERIWTKKNSVTGKPKWQLPDDITAEEIIEDTNSPYKEYRLHGVPEYNEYIDTEIEKPIVIYVDREVIPNPMEIDPLNKIILSEGYSYPGQAPIAKGIKWYKIEHLGKGNDKRTKISIYPKGTLDSGKFYKFKIPNNTFVTRNGEAFDLGAEFDFVINGDKTNNTGIYRVNVTNVSTPLLTSNFLNQNDPIKLNIKGYNFNEKIKGIRFIRQRDNHTITLKPENIKFRSVTELEADIKGDTAREFAKEGNGGVYKIYIDFENGPPATGNSAFGTTLIVKERPIVLRTNPGKTSKDAEGNYKDEEKIDLKDIYTTGSGDDKVQYISIVFTDIDNKLKLMSGLKNYDGINIIENGREVNLIDKQKDMLIETNNGEFTLRIPLKSKLSYDTAYEIIIPENFVDFTDIENGTGGNKEYEWSFKTTDGPVELNMERNFKGSAPENYGEKHEVILKGKNINDDVKVYFKGVSSKKYEAKVLKVVTVSKDGDQLIHIYLPTGTNRLEVGLYDIFVENKGATPQEITDGVYSIVEKGNYAPNENYRVKDAIMDKSKKPEEIKGGLKEIIRTSKNELELTSKYTSQILDLDFILGEEVITREIKYSGSSISRLDTKSKWADIKLIGIKRDSSNQMMTIRIGRTEPAVRDIIKKKLIGDSIKSDFIQISGTNYSLDSAELSIPYKESNGDNLKILRYDEDTRRIDKNISFRVNKNDKRVEITNTKKGIFIIVE